MPRHIGSIEVICGPMFSGKTEELIRRIRRATIARQTVLVFKPLLDTRYDTNAIQSHSGLDHIAQPVEQASDILDIVKNHIGDVSVVAIDEAQFFDCELETIVKELRSMGIRVIVAGLDNDFRGEAFGPMPLILCAADEVLKLKAVCMVCGKEASCTQRLVDGKPAEYGGPTILIGATESYEARCHCHHVVPGAPD